MTPLYLLRHGPTDASKRGAPLGRLDLPLSPEGHLLWPSIKDQLRSFELQHIATSDLCRAREGAQELGAVLGLGVQILPALGEQAFGDWEGLPWTEIQGAEEFWKDPVHQAPPGGESFAACAARAWTAFEALPPGRPTLILAHAGPLRAILGRLLGLPLERCLDLAWDPFGLSRLDRYAPDRAALRFHNHGAFTERPRIVLAKESRAPESRKRP
jgi:broad specificity phosphatase PhoE